MSTTLVSPTPKAETPRIQHGRGVNALAEYFRRTLSVPDIYIAPKLPMGLRPDLLAVDRAGSGDFHIPELKSAKGALTAASLTECVRQLHALSAHFRYLVVADRQTANRAAQLRTLFSPDGIGRIGVLLLAYPELSVEQIVPSERFRVPALTVEKYERFFHKVKPDIYVRV